MSGADRCSACGDPLPAGDGGTQPRRCARCLDQRFGADARVKLKTREFQLSRGFRERYELGQRIGQGAMGAVHRAVRRADGRAVAVKFLLEERDHELTERFLREGRVMAAIDHPHVVPVFEAGVVDGHPYLVCEFLPGGAMSDLIARERTLPLVQAVGLVVDVLEGLQAAHEHGVVHRDVKPANILLDADGRASVADFGIAKHYGEIDVRLTATGASIGSPAYMSPEVVMGEKAGVAADLFAAGVILYECLAGVRTKAGAKRLAEVASGVPAGVERVVMAALARYPSERPQSALDMVVALRRAVPGLPAVLSRRQPARDPRPSNAAEHGRMPPALLERFRPLRVVDRRSGVMLEAEDLMRGGLVALSIRTAEPHWVTLLENETAVLLAVSHPAVVTLVDRGVSGENPWMAYAWLPGPRFCDELAKDRPSVGRAVGVVIELLEALQAVHDAGFVHLDVKPENLRLGRTGRYVLTVFQLGRPAPRPGQVSDGKFLGTPRYMSPEQARGDLACPRADQFSAATVLYEALTGVRPASGDDLRSLLENLLDEPPRPPSQLVSLPRGLEAVVLRALAKSPDARFESANAMASALRPFAR